VVKFKDGSGGWGGLSIFYFKSVRKAKKIPALKERHRRYFKGILPISPSSRTEIHPTKKEIF
jgi:hypothetical protein